MQRLPVHFHVFDGQIYMIEPQTTLVPFRGVQYYANSYMSSLITIWTNHGKGIYINLAALPNRKITDVFVKIFDGSILMESQNPTPNPENHRTLLQNLKTTEPYSKP